MADINPDVLAQVIRRITETTPAPLRWRVGAQASLKDDLHLDNLDRLTIACAIDEDLAIEIPDAAITEWETVADVVATADRLFVERYPTAIRLISASELSDDDRAKFETALAQYRLGDFPTPLFLKL